MTTKAKTRVPGPDILNVLREIQDEIADGIIFQQSPSGTPTRTAAAKIVRLSELCRAAILREEQRRAAVPDLLDAAREALEAIKNHPEAKEWDGSFPRGSVYGILRAAIAKAEEGVS